MSAEVSKVETPPRPRKQRALQQRTVETRERILDAALREFAAFGFEGASTRTIAAEAGVQHGLITYHFAGKDGLWREVLRRVQDDWRNLLQARLHDLHSVAPAETLRRVLEDFIRFSARNPHFHAVMSHASSNKSERLEWLLDAYIQPHFAVIGQLIRDAQKAGRFVDGDPAKLHYLFIGAAVRVFMVSEEATVLTGDSPFSAAFIDEHVELCLGLFFRAPPARPRARAARL